MKNRENYIRGLENAVTVSSVVSWLVLGVSWLLIDGCLDALLDVLACTGCFLVNDFGS